MKFHFRPGNWIVSYFEEGGKILEVSGFWGFRCTMITKNFEHPIYFQCNDFEIVRYHEFWGDEGFFDIVTSYDTRIELDSCVKYYGKFVTVENADWLFSMFQKRFHAERVDNYIQPTGGDKLMWGGTLPGNEFFWRSESVYVDRDCCWENYCKFIRILNFLDMGTRAWIDTFPIKGLPKIWQNKFDNFAFSLGYNDEE